MAPFNDDPHSRFSCFDEEVNERPAFTRQTPRSRYYFKTYKQFLSTPYPPSRGARFDKDATPEVYLTDPHFTTATSYGEKLYRIWVDCGKLYTRRTKVYHFDDRKQEQDELYTLYEAYGHGLRLGVAGSQFRDAAIDPIIEFIDGFGGGYGDKSFRKLSDATKDHPDCLLRKLMVLHFVLNCRQPDWCWPNHGPKDLENGRLLEMANAVKEDICFGAPSHLPRDKTSKEIWEDIHGKGRCRFHEHEEGICRKHL